MAPSAEDAEANSAAAALPKPENEGELSGHWWRDERRVEHVLAGVFEGGGAKGVAYIGALNAALEKKCWFGAVAGASAGAITAALVAAGLSPKKIGDESEVAFSRIRLSGIESGVKQLRLGFGYVDNADIRDWLESLLAVQIEQLTGSAVDGAVTFLALYKATEIELNVVAADVSLQRQIVFSVWDTPYTQVADAVIASSSIPFAFPPAHLAVPSRDGGPLLTHTLVDGGVWSNFPLFVFTSPSFRRYMGREEDVAEDHVVGFILDEQEVTESVDFKHSMFVDINAAPDALEWHREPAAAQTPPSGIRTAIGFVVRVLLLPLTLLVAFGAWLSQGRAQPWRGRWPPPKSGVVKWIVDRVSDSLSSLHSGWVAIIALGAIVLGVVFSVQWLIVNFLLLRIDEVRLDLATHSGFEAGNELLQVVLAVVGIIGALTLAMLALAGVAANWVLLGPARQMLYGVASTYLAGPGAPPWAGAADEFEHVIRLPIPRRLTTLAFDRSVPEVEEAVRSAISDAKIATLERLGEILKTPKPANRARRPDLPEESDQPTPLTPRTTPAGVGGGAFMIRMTAIAIVGGLIATIVAYMLPDPAWHRYDTGILICAQALKHPDDFCSLDRTGELWATVGFGPAAAGHEAHLELSVKPPGRTERSPSVRVAKNGAVAYVRIDRRKLCGGGDCEVLVKAIVDGSVAVKKLIKQKTEVSITH